MRLTISVLLVLSVAGCGGSNKGGGSGGRGGSSGGSDMGAGTGGNGNGGGGGSAGDGGTASTDMAAACDVGAQTGCPTGEKCVPGFHGGACVANGTATEGQPCTVDQTTNADNCVGGLICDSTVGSANICRKICTADSSCTTSGQLCAGYTSKYGVCLPSCTLGGSDCAAGTDCSTAVDDISASKTTSNGFFVCKTTGTGAQFSTCQGDSDCAAGLECDPSGQKGVYWCLPNCSTTMACPAAPPSTTDMGAATITCQVFANLPNGEGYCAGN